MKEQREIEDFRIGHMHMHMGLGFVGLGQIRTGGCKVYPFGLLLRNFFSGRVQ